MTEFEVVHIINILAIIFFTAYLSSIVGRMEYSMWAVIVRGYFRNQAKYREFIKGHKYYIWCFLLIPLMLWLALIFIGQLNTGLVHIRAIWAVRLSPFIWITLTLAFKGFQKRIKQDESH